MSTNREVAFRLEDLAEKEKEVARAIFIIQKGWHKALALKFWLRSEIDRRRAKQFHYLADIEESSFEEAVKELLK